jgi:hypothetical protein
LIQECNAWRVAAKEYLCYGDMTKPLPYTCDEYCNFVMFRRQDFEKKIPKVMSNAFTYKGNRADIYVNYTCEAVTVSIPVREGEKVYLTSEDYAKGKATVRNEETITVAPLSVILIENVK